jgi:flagellar protein FlgJ
MTNSLSLTGSAPSLGSPPADTSAANTYTDINGLAALKRDPNSPQTISAVAGQVEALFLQMMLKSMRDANAAVGESDNEMGMYQDMFDKQIALTISQHQDLGLAALLTRQVTGATPAAGPASTVTGSATTVTGPARTMTGSATTATQSVSAVGQRAGSAPPAADTETMAERASDFVNQVLPTIRNAAQALGVNPLGLLAQAALETGWGKRMARTADGAASLNLFGIKADENWDGARATASTVEYSGGVATQRHAAFRVYGTLEESVKDFVNLLKNSPRYHQVVAAGQDAQAYVNSIGQSGYATDPDYSHKLNEILHSSMLRAALTGNKL